MPFAILTAADEGRIHADCDRRRRCRRRDHGAILKLLAEFQGMGAQRLMALAGINRKHLLEHARGDAVGHQSREMGLELIQLWRRPAIRWPAYPGLPSPTLCAPIPGKPHRHLAAE